MTGGDYDPAVRAANQDPEDRLPGYFVGGDVPTKSEVRKVGEKVGEKAEEAVQAAERGAKKVGEKVGEAAH